MLTSKQCYEKYGNPNRKNNMVNWEIPFELHIKPLPYEIFLNKDLIEPLSKGLQNLIESGIQKELKTWDGCFCIRTKRKSKSLSLHSWGVAFDVNAAWNGMGKKPTLSKEFVECFTSVGLDWGGYWKNPIDGMHFQLKELP